MSTALMSLIPIALLGVLIVLGLGLWNMMRDGSVNRSQQLMRWRVGLQFAAVIAVTTAVYFIRG